jgi:predicted ATP-grasp superfamily ATP-dependent carboligase
MLNQKFEFVEAHIQKIPKFDKNNFILMDLNIRKIEFIQDFLKLQSEEIISKFEQLLKNEKHKISPMTIEEFNRRIDKSMKDSRNGHTISAEELIADIEKWS